MGQLHPSYIGFPGLLIDVGSGLVHLFNSVRSSQSLRRLAHGFGLTMLQADLASTPKQQPLQLGKEPHQSAVDRERTQAVKQPTAQRC